MLESFQNLLLLAGEHPKIVSKTCRWSRFKDCEFRL